MGNLAYVVKVEENNRCVLAHQIREEERIIAQDDSEEDLLNSSEWSDEDFNGEEEWMVEESIFRRNDGMEMDDAKGKVKSAGIEATMETESGKILEAPVNVQQHCST